VGGESVNFYLRPAGATLRAMVWFLLGALLGWLLCWLLYRDPRPRLRPGQGDDLDRMGFNIGLERKRGEPDAAYRGRMVLFLRGKRGHY